MSTTLDPRVRCILECIVSKLRVDYPANPGWYYGYPKTDEMSDELLIETAYTMERNSLVDAVFPKPTQERFPDVPFQSLEEVMESCRLYSRAESV